VDDDDDGRLMTERALPATDQLRDEPSRPCRTTTGGAAAAPRAMALRVARVACSATDDDDGDVDDDDADVDDDVDVDDDDDADGADSDRVREDSARIAAQRIVAAQHSSRPQAGVRGCDDVIR
jgi:hypothetical protein